MKNRLFTSFIIAVSITIIFTMVSCEGGRSTSTSADRTAVALSTDTTSAAADESFINLHTLWIKSEDFERDALADKRLLLRFYVQKLDALNYLTLHGWSPIDTGSVRFNTIPNVKLEIGQLTNPLIKIDSETYLGNLVIKKRTVNKMRVTDSLYIVFSPEKMPTGQIQYNIKYTNGDPKRMDFNFLAPSDGMANPTPPRNYRGDD